MKNILIVLLFVLIGGCSTHRKLERHHEMAVNDSSSYRSSSMIATRADSLQALIRKQVIERSETGTVVIERGDPEPTNDPFKITAAFTIDTSAKGDTLRLVSQENDQVQFQVYYDRKTNQAVAQIHGKGGKTTKTPFEKITITNASVNKTIDSTADIKAHSGITVAHNNSDSGKSHVVKESTSEKSELVRKQTGIANIVGGIVVIVVALVVLLVVFRKFIF